METVITLLGVFFISLAIIKITGKKADIAFAGRIAMSAMLLLTCLGHFMFSKGMSMLLPDFIPFRVEIIYLTGLIELLAAVGLLLPKFQVLTGRLLIIFFILILPSNIYGAIHHVDLQKANYTGAGVGYLWYRIPLQLFYIAWVYFSAVNRKVTSDHTPEIFNLIKPNFTRK